MMYRSETPVSINVSIVFRTSSWGKYTCLQWFLRVHSFFYKACGAIVSFHFQLLCLSSLKHEYNKEYQMSRQDQKKWSTRVQGLLIQDDESHDILEQTSHVVGTKLVWKKECPLLIVFSVEFSKNSLWGAQIAPPPGITACGRGSLTARRNPTYKDLRQKQFNVYARITEGTGAC